MADIVRHLAGNVLSILAMSGHLCLTTDAQKVEMKQFFQSTIEESGSPVVHCQIVARRTLSLTKREEVWS